MEEQNWLAERFEAERPHLRAVAYQMLGRLDEADDAVQEAWLHLSHSDTSGVKNLGRWLTTVVARVCLDLLRSRKSRREEPLEADHPAPIMRRAGEVNPEQEAELSDSVGLALLVVLETLTPAERVAFVLHDLFDVPFQEIAPLVGRSPTAARQLASRARRRVQGTSTVKDPDLPHQRQVVEAFLAASRAGDFAALLEMLDPDVVSRADAIAASAAGSPEEARGASFVARQFLGRSRGALLALVDGAVGVLVLRRGRLFLVLRFTIKNGKIAEIDAIADPTRLRQMRLAVLDD